MILRNGCRLRPPYFSLLTFLSSSKDSSRSQSNHSMSKSMFVLWSDGPMPIQCNQNYTWWLAYHCQDIVGYCSISSEANASAASIRFCEVSVVLTRGWQIRLKMRILPLTRPYLRPQRFYRNVMPLVEKLFNWAYKCTSNDCNVAGTCDSTKSVTYPVDLSRIWRIWIRFC